MGLVSAGTGSATCSTARAGSSCARRSRSRRRTAILLQSVARVIISDQRGTLAEQVGKHMPPERNVPLLFAEGAPALQDPRRMALTAGPACRRRPQRAAKIRGRSRRWPTSSCSTTARRLRRRRPRIRDRDARRRDDAGALVQRDGQSELRQRGHRKRAGLHLVRERARVPPDAVAQRSGGRHRRRSVLPARRGQRAVLVADAAAPPRQRRLPHPPWLRLQRVRTRRRRHRQRTVGVRGAGRRGQVLGAEAAQPVRTRRAGCRPPAMSNGCWATSSVKSQMHVVTELDPASGALSARNPYNTEFAGRVAFFDADAPNEPRTQFTGDRTEFLGRNGSLGDPAALQREQLSGKLGAGLDPCAAIQVPFELADGQEHEMVFRLGVGSDAAHALQLAQRVTGQRGCATTRLDAVRIHWHGRWARCRWRRRTRAGRAGQRLAAVPDPGLPLCGRAAATTSRAARSVSATSCRTPWHWCTPSPRWLREHLLLCAAHQFPRATCSTGGIRRRDAACARAVPTTTCGCRWPPAATCRSPATAACWTRRCASSKAALVNRGRGVVLRPAGRLPRPAAVAVRALRAGVLQRGTELWASTACR